jgi:hypothetical protein
MLNDLTSRVLLSSALLPEEVRLLTPLPSLLLPP